VVVIHQARGEPDAAQIAGLRRRKRQDGSVIIGRRFREKSTRARSRRQLRREGWGCILKARGQVTTESSGE
jgi:hypothetical protein|tara:strand:- start:790 stop:1002 length:213 start_codon:yes stop_codon:yes gene_type:complete